MSRGAIGAARGPGQAKTTITWRRAVAAFYFAKSRSYPILRPWCHYLTFCFKISDIQKILVYDITVKKFRTCWFLCYFDFILKIGGIIISSSNANTYHVWKMSIIVLEKTAGVPKFWSSCFGSAALYWRPHHSTLRCPRYLHDRLFDRQDRYST